MPPKTQHLAQSQTNSMPKIIASNWKNRCDKKNSKELLPNYQHILEGISRTKR
jgi:hypothetical protein